MTDQSRPRVWITGRIEQIPELAQLHEVADVEYRDHPTTISAEEYLPRIREFDYIMSVMHAWLDVEVARNIIESVNTTGKRLMGFVNRGVGVNHIDLPLATKLGIPVSNTPGVLVEATAAHTVGLIIAGSRLYHQGLQMAQGNQWLLGQATLVGQPIYGRTLGIIGMGAIGQRVARTMKLGFDMDIVYWSRNRKSEVEGKLGIWYAEKDEILKRADILSLHTALAPETEGIIGERELGLMKPTAILVNASRGKLVDQAALIKAIDLGHIFAAAIDCTEPEPPAMEHPILVHPRIFVQPHSGSGDTVAREAMTRLAVENMLDLLKGQKPRNLLNPEVYAQPST